MIQGGFRLSPGSRRDDPVPVGRLPTGRRNNAYVVLIEEYEIEIALHPNMLESVIQQEEVRTCGSDQRFSGAAAIRVHHNGGKRVAGSQHKGFVTAFFCRSDTGNGRKRQAGRVRAVTAGEDCRTQAILFRSGKQPVCDRRLAGSSPRDIAYGNAGDGRAPASEKTASGKTTPDLPACAVEQRERKKQRCKNVLERVAFRHDTTG